MKERKIDPDIRALLKRDRIKYRTALFLQGLSGDERPLLFRLFEEIALGTNKQREVTEWLEDVRKRDNKSAVDILAELGLKEILDDVMQNGPQKGDLFRDRLFALRYPEVSRYLDGLKARLNALKLPENVKLVPLTPLEDGEFRMEIVFHSTEDIQAKLGEVNTLISGKAFQGLWGR